MDHDNAYYLWEKDEFFDRLTHKELFNLDPVKDAAEMEDRCYRDFEFGKGGLRGIMGAGTNRMNRYTVGKATKGLGAYLLENYGSDACRTRGVVIGYDTRNKSRDYANVTVAVLSGMGFIVCLHNAPRPTSQLSFSVKFLNALAGIVIAVSHNSKEYNGYKVYDEE